MSAIDLWRSQTMSLLAFSVSKEAAPALVTELMNIGCVQIVDACSHMSLYERTYSADLLQLGTLESKLAFVKDQFLQLQLSLPEQTEPDEIMPAAHLETTLTGAIKTIKSLNDDYNRHLTDLRVAVQYQTILGTIRDYAASSQQFSTPGQFTDVGLGRTRVGPGAQDPEGEDNLLISGIQASNDLYLTVCTIPDNSTAMLQRMAIRATLSNCIFEVVDKIHEPSVSSLLNEQEPVQVEKKKKKKGEPDAMESDIVFIYVPGTQMQQKIASIVASLSGTVHYMKSVSDMQVHFADQLQEEVAHVAQTVEDYRTSLRLSKHRITELLNGMGAMLQANLRNVYHEREVLNTLNKFRGHDGRLIGIGWVPTHFKLDVEHVVESCNARLKGITPSFVSDLNALDPRRKHGTVVQIDASTLDDAVVDALQNVPRLYLRSPPTAFTTGKYTRVFQNIIESYGIPTYKEINPAFFYLYQFPFTFAVMYGDVGHGIIMTVVAALMVGYERKLSTIKSDMVSLVFAGRYIILLMSIFSIITGLLYNDTFALAFDFFKGGSFQKVSGGDGTTWRGVRDGSGALKGYPFGINWLWRFSDNSMVFTNSYKMKMAVIIGVTQMLFGLVLKLINAIYMRDYLTIFSCWIPEFLFMTAFFGYMVFTIIYKWLSCWLGVDGTPSNAPGLTNMLIQMFLSIGSEPDSSELLYASPTFQKNLHLALAIICVISLLWLAIVKPVYEVVQLKKAKKAGLPHTPPVLINIHRTTIVEKTEEVEGEPLARDDAGHPTVVEQHVDKGKVSHEDDEEGEHGVGDIVVHQVIHTIEYVLGAISHTASYLRLWALSLAHAQLSEVFYEQLFGLSDTIRLMFDNDAVGVIVQGISYFITYSGWFGVTIGVIILMEALSAFLHALRLAWIEFNSKFFAAEGYLFEPVRKVEYTLSADTQED
ncbi:putative Vacuolar H+-transporting ATPase subunit a [Giardia muris]|uniref:V-type proton ATPase subunit a n=1 Tax=Giardia muris TaxID=5742 RepID=A0A4Z1SQJ3_GIAMU|nr:putative Vacuolar H+-transporting ATPase subunit a [Giardia muris]|eukprot:TNJ28096.1 putative Vacuolar H+-transporting ATPase subunit a [Giardia muris]